MSEPTKTDQPDAALLALRAHNERVRAGGRPPGGGGRAIWRLVAWTLILAALALIGLGIALRSGAFDADPAPPVTRAAPTHPASTGLAPAVTLTSTRATTTRAQTTTTTAAPPATARLVIEAARGDSWLEVRVGSATGRVLYSGILRRGTVDHETGARLWVRFGSVGNLDLTLNGKPVRTANPGTVEVVVTPKGLQ